MPKRDAARSMSLTSQESYSAVIIADMVAEVQNQPDYAPDSSQQKNNAVQRSSSTKSEVFHRRGSSKNKKEEVNRGYDGHQAESSLAAVVDVEAMETVSLGKSNGTDITKGVILNAQLDHKLGTDFLNGGGKAIELNSVAVPEGKPDTKDLPSSSFKDMSALRRIAFAASFLPSIMFVLCFAVILPCEKKMPCVEDMWTMTLNNTKVTSGLKFPDTIVFSYSQDSTSGLLGIDSTTGITSWDDILSSPPRFVGCANLIANDSQACLVSDASGAVRFYDAQTGDKLLRWVPTKGASTPSLPTLLPDCDGDGIKEVAVAVNSTHFKVLFKGFKEFTLDIPGRCDQVPEGLVPWTTENGTDLVFTCRNGTDEHLIRISSEKWCMSLKKNKGEIVNLDTRTMGNFTNSLIRPAGDGIVVWSDEEVTMIERKGQKRWTVPTFLDHNIKNRFVLYGQFNKTHKQVALFSSDILTGLQVSTLDSDTGEIVWNRTVSYAEINDVSLIQGSEKDFALVVMRKIDRSNVNRAVTHLSEVSTTLLNLMSSEKVDAKSPNDLKASITMVEEISLMELNGDVAYTIRDEKLTLLEGEAFNTTVTVIPKQTKEAESLSVVALKQPTELNSGIIQLTRINVANWDISLSQDKQCLT